METMEDYIIQNKKQHIVFNVVLTSLPHDDLINPMNRNFYAYAYNYYYYFTNVK